MEYAYHEHEANQRTDDGALARDYWEAAAARGSTTALAKLAGPEMPDTLAYLWSWTLEIHGRSGVSMSGMVPATYSTVKDWAVLTGRDPTPDEVHAMLRLDGALLSGRPDEPEEAAEPLETPAWPAKKAEA